MNTPAEMIADWCARNKDTAQPTVMALAMANAAIAKLGGKP